MRYLSEKLKVGDVIKYNKGNTLYLIIEIEELNGLRIYYYKHPRGTIYTKKESDLYKQISKVEFTPEQFSNLPKHHKDYPDNLFKQRKHQNTEPGFPPYNNKDWICDRKFWNDNKYFLLQLLSTHYPFNETQLKKYRKVLTFGTEYVSVDERSSFDITGLIYNKNIIWTKSLQEIYYCPSELIYVGESIDVYSRETDFNRYPITFENNLDEYKDFEINRALMYCCNAEDMMQCDDDITAKCKELRIKVDKSYSFNNSELKDIITEFNLLIASYEHFYNQVMVLIEKKTDNFNIDNFLDEVLANYESALNHGDPAL